MKKINKYLSAGSTVAIFFIVIISGFIIFNPPPPLKPDNNIPNASKRMFEYYNEVSYYNESIWNRVMGNSSSPHDLFGPNSTIINGTRTSLSLGYRETQINIFNVVEFLFNVTYSELDKTLMSQSLNIGDEWSGWIIRKDIWNFKVDNWGPYFSDPDFFGVEFPVLKYPQNFTDVLNELQILVNNSYLGIDFPNATDLIYNMIVKRMDFPIPTAIYLNQTITYLQPQNASILGSTLILNLQKREDYAIEAYYNNEGGYMELLSYYDNSSRLFYQQKGWGRQIILPAPEITGVNIPVILCFSIITFIGIAIKTYKKLELKAQ